MNRKAINYIDGLFGQQLDDENWISYDSGKLLIDGVNGDIQVINLNSEAVTDDQLTLQQAINDNQGETKKILIEFKNLMN